NLAEAWKFWKQDFTDFLEAAGYATQSEKTKTAVFRHVYGDELKTQYRSLDIKPKAGETELKLVQILDEFDKFFGDYENEIFASFVFLEIKQKPHEKFQEFYTRLKLAAEDCNYDNPERMLRNKIVQGINDKPLQERLLRETSRKPKTIQEIVIAETPDSIINEFHDVFSGIGKLNKVVKIHLKDNYTTSVAAARKIPLALHDKVKTELNRIENMGVITKVEQPTEWVSNIVVIDIPNKLRICIDPRSSNEAIKISHSPIPSAEGLMTNL
ncbi:hypothetical protein AVEN_165396-2-1, partial [Araneus ventricosus]